MKVIDADFEYTGGGCMTAYGKLSDGTYFAATDDTFSTFDSDFKETLTEEFYKETEGDTSDWEEAHLINTENTYGFKYKEELNEILCKKYPDYIREIRDMLKV